MVRMVSLSYFPKSLISKEFYGGVLQDPDKSEALARRRERDRQHKAKRKKTKKK